MNSGVKVLIVEDEPHALMGLAELISGWGYRTETAHDGIEGWEKAMAWNPAIVVTDLKMPRLDGTGPAGQVRRRGSSLDREDGRGPADRARVDPDRGRRDEAGRL